jgi:hypothetical protein
MYKEVFASKETNAAVALRVEQKMKQVAAKVADPDQSDADFTANLLGLCTLNRMAESHQANNAICVKADAAGNEQVSRAGKDAMTTETTQIGAGESSPAPDGSAPFTYEEYRKCLAEADGRMKANNGHEYLHILKTRCQHCGASPRVKTRCRGWFQTFLNILGVVLQERGIIAPNIAICVKAAGKP